MPTIVAIRHQFTALPEEVKTHLSGLQPLLDAADLDLSLAYLFMVIEQGRYRSLKCILVRNLKCMTSVVDAELERRSFTRTSFRATIKSLIGIDLASADYRALENAETVRDTIFHGRSASDAKKREAIENSLKFIAKFGAKVKQKTGKNPFATLKGLTSRIRPVDRDQSIWIVRGVFAINNVQKISEA
ncbi:hypothetical protein SAMN05444149_102422 [Pseudosulfitobacter pseudonitzschiae]|uniref:hypothetical protein n=1 Tax=Pseudosulfitobacter pseudonitzschiae TaxID=1402135 RepID=UPI0005664F86|nr:hypothetical protein [Pseudosulfitobacter pseudonitzschiae]QKS09779.1 hypothetical protein HT745_15460 [Pseudosulfitobacter pseudonitzschiae]SHE95952.1 hypothetical protein SAMN05444149_102422 [Pseudosulfitobacter pseudonitzschiae]